MNVLEYNFEKHFIYIKQFDEIFKIKKIFKN